MKLILFSIFMTTTLMAQAATYLSCEGRFASADPNAGGYMGEENVSVTVNDHPSFSAPQFSLQKHRDRWNLGGGSSEVRPAADGDFILYGGHTQFKGDIVGKTMTLVATGSVDHAFNFGPFPFPNGKTIDLATLKVISSEIAILHLDNRDIGLTCILKK